MTAYYNEIDKFAAQMLRNLIAAGHIAPGDVDERSIEDVLPSDLCGYTQCHFFAGVGVWSYALRQAGWADDRSVWTGSCPCQPFSAAGQGAGFDDERHLWPAFHHLIKECKPASILGEQVASKDADPWIDLVHADLEALGYAFGCVPFPSAGVGAPHIRDRNYWVADATDKRYERAGAARGWRDGLAHGGDADRVADLSGSGRGEEHAYLGGCAFGDRAQGLAAGLMHGSSVGGVADANMPEQHGWASIWKQSIRDLGATRGHWSDADWIYCTDGKFRPVEPGTFPLAHGVTSRMGRLRAYGNAINAKAAQAFIECFMPLSLINTAQPAMNNVAILETA